MLYVTCIEMLCIVNCVAVLYNLRRISNASYPDLFLQISLLILLFLSYYYVFVTQCQFSVFFYFVHYNIVSREYFINRHLYRNKAVLADSDRTNAQ